MSNAGASNVDNIDIIFRYSIFKIEDYKWNQLLNVNIIRKLQYSEQWNWCIKIIIFEITRYL